MNHGSIFAFPGFLRRLPGAGISYKSRRETGQYSETKTQPVMTIPSPLFLVLAAGQGTRMRSSLAKVLHPIAGQPMVLHVLGMTAVEGSRKAVITAPHMDDVRSAVSAFDDGVETFIQEEQLGTAHAVLSARSALQEAEGDVVILYGDTPLLTRTTIEQLRAALRNGADIAVLGFEASDPTGYGRLLTDDSGQLVAIREHKDATDDERLVTFCNSGVFAFAPGRALGLLERIGNDNAKGEYYLTDAVELARADGLNTVAVPCDEEEVMGVNSRLELSEAEGVYQWRRREEIMMSGVTLIAPETVFFSHDTVLEQDVLVEPNVVFGPGVRVESGAKIRAFSHLEGAHVASGATVGPYARLRPGAEIGGGSRIGNFVEVKNATIEDGAKVNHLSYVGDARVGKDANIGAGTITCNYDGFTKSHTDIGEGAFIGSNSALVAPVTIGNGAIVGAGSTISKNVGENALALTRAKQEEHDGWAMKFRTIMSREKNKKKST